MTLVASLAHISHEATRESVWKMRQFETRDTWGAQAYSCSTSSTASERNEELARLTRTFAVGW